jgi:hypothetical protein
VSSNVFQDDEFCHWLNMMSFEPIETKKIACLNCSLAACEPILEMMSCLVFTKLLICVSKWI